jgi:MbtH protein
MSSTFDDPDGRFSVVVNDEEQYSIWPAGLDVPNGWRLTGPADAPRSQCLDYIDEVWTDMRPKSIRAEGDSGDRGRNVREGRGQ